MIYPDQELYTGDEYGDDQTGVNFAVDEDELGSWRKFIPFIQRPRGRVGLLENAAVKGRHRKGIGTQAQDDYLWIPRFRNVTVDPAYPNRDPAWDQDGVQWGMRTYGIVAGLLVDVTFRNIIGKTTGDEPPATTNEGTAIYNTHSPKRGAVITYRRLTVENCGGHGLNITTSYDGSQGMDALNPHRVGRAIQPERGGFVVVANARLTNTDISESRGSYAFDFSDPFSTMNLRRCIVRQDIERGFRKGDRWFNSRGGLSVKGTCDGVNVSRCEFYLPSPSDKTHQISIRGPEYVRLINSHFDCDSISVNHTGHGVNWHPGLPLTKAFGIRNCTGRARVHFNNEFIGMIGDLNGLWETPLDYVAPE